MGHYCIMMHTGNFYDSGLHVDMNWCMEKVSNIERSGKGVALDEGSHVEINLYIYIYLYL